jgi:hypothetical protein
MKVSVTTPSWDKNLVSTLHHISFVLQNSCVRAFEAATMSADTLIKFTSSGCYMMRARVLMLADDCNPEWPSLPVVGYKYARALAEVTDATIVTHIRNRENIEKANEITDKVTNVDNEWIARPMGKLSTFLRGGDQRAWSTNQIMAYLPYVFFEREAIKAFRGALDAGEFDIVHRITPMSPALPSYAAGRVQQPFVTGPLNGSLDWPKEFAEEQKREGEAARKLRWLYKYMPYCWIRTSQLMAPTRNGSETSATSGPVRVGFIWPSSLTCTLAA